MFREYLSRVFQSLIEGCRKPRSRRIPRASRPEATRLAVECLEDRMLLSTITLNANNALLYAPSGSAANTLTVTDNQSTHRYTFSNVAENITLTGSFISPSGSGTHTVSFGDGNIHFTTVNMSSPYFTVNIEQTLAAYNAGPNRVVEWRTWGTFREPAEFVEMIPFTETRDYVQAVLRNAEMYRRLYQ